ncbi:MAG: 30S ribosomal protein S9 [Patescibacteria group bacterium]
MSDKKSDKKTEKKNKNIRATNYFEAVGRRKTSVARIRLFNKAEPEILINDKKLGDYFFTEELRQIIEDPLKKMKLAGKFRILAKVSGGGIHSQAEAVRHGIARVLIKFNADFRKRLKKAQFLTRDQRMKERRKFGLKKARRAPQWSKR